eukprot:tig00021168_g19101.t1
MDFRHLKGNTGNTFDNFKPSPPAVMPGLQVTPPTYVTPSLNFAVGDNSSIRLSGPTMGPAGSNGKVGLHFTSRF